VNLGIASLPRFSGGRTAGLVAGDEICYENHVSRWVVFVAPFSPAALCPNGAAELLSHSRRLRTRWQLHSNNAFTSTTAATISTPTTIISKSA
jgi:hypothetical protein